MDIKENKGLILIIIGIILTITLIGIFIGIPLIIIGTYYLNKKSDEKEKEISDKLQEKQNELDNIDNKLEELQKEKEKEINILLGEKKEELANIDDKLKEKEEEKEKEINIKLRQKNEELNNIHNKLAKIEKEKQMEMDAKIKTKDLELSNIEKEIRKKKKELIFVEDEIQMQEIGLYEPKYKFSTAVAYKEKLDEVRKKQKELVKNKTAATGVGLTYSDGNKKNTKALNNDNKKQMIKHFNLECDTIISKVKLSNRENSVKRINKSFETLNNLNERNLIHVTKGYLVLKLKELDIALEYELKKQEEKEEIRESKEREREERKIQKQLDAQLKKTNEQKRHLEIEIEATNNLLQKSESDEEIELLKNKLKELELAVEKSKKDERDITERKKRTGAGYVYILSNIGSFGENVYKIGVTRRDDPMGRVTELSDASVPFRFDNHVFIFSEEAFDLEKELHTRFDHKRVNKVNMRKEFFNITLDDVKQIVNENKELVHSFVEKPEAQEYYDTLKMIR